MSDDSKNLTLKIDMKGERKNWNLIWFSTRKMRQNASLEQSAQGPQILSHNKYKIFFRMSVKITRHWLLENWGGNKNCVRHQTNAKIASGHRTNERRGPADAEAHADFGVSLRQRATQLEFTFHSWIWILTQKWLQFIANYFMIWIFAPKLNCN